MEFFNSNVGKQAGFSLVEIMVGALLGLIGTIVIMQVFALSEEQKRNTTGSGDASQSAAAALFQIQRDGMAAGHGISKFFYGCPVEGWYASGVGGTDLKFVLVPVTIEKGATAADSDMLSFAYGTSSMGAQAAGVHNPQEAVSLIDVSNRYGYKRGDLIVYMNYKESDLTPYKKYCNLAQVSDLPDLGTSSKRIVALPGNYTNESGEIREIRYNRPGGLCCGKQLTLNAFTDSKGGVVMNLGVFPRAVTYKVSNGQLVLTDGLKGGSDLPIADQVVLMKAHFGIDGTPIPDLRFDGSASPVALPVGNFSLGSDHWAESLPPPTVAAPPSLGIHSDTDWARVIAVRVVLVTRGEKQRPNASGVCETTTSFPVWKAANNKPLDVSADPDWRCYKYSPLEVTIPLRNLMWSNKELGIEPRDAS